jgi:uncharacterized protein DUF397
MESTNLNWRKASYSSNGGAECVEVADQASRVLVRDTKDRTGLVLRFSPTAWRRFTSQLERSLASGLTRRPTHLAALSRQRMPVLLLVSAWLSHVLTAGQRCPYAAVSDMTSLQLPSEITLSAA